MSTLILSGLDKKILKGLAPYASTASKVFDAWGCMPEDSIQTSRSLIEISHLGLTELSKVSTTLEVSVSMELIFKCGNGYKIAKGMHDKFKYWAYALNVISFYATEIHLDLTLSTVVLTKPVKPSMLEKKLSDKGWRTSEIEPTLHSFYSIADLASNKLVIMTPFLDDTGAEWVKDIFSRTQKSVQCILILRSLERPGARDYPVGYLLIKDWLLDNNIKVYNYSLQRSEDWGRETFHAKVVLADRRIAYIGSSNMTEHSSYSMEMGVKITGRAAADVDVIVESLISVSTLWS